MKRLATHIILALAAIISLSGCSHNNGDIGYWLGLWHLDSIEIDGTPVTHYDGNTYFMFQGKVFCIRCVDEAHQSYIESYAQWHESDDHQHVTLTFADENFKPGVTPLVPLEVVTTLTVDTLTSQEMTLKHTHSLTGSTLTYHLTRWE